MIRDYILAGVIAGCLAQPALAARTKKPVDQHDAIKALIHPGAASRKVEAANRATAIEFWQAVAFGPAGEDDSKYLSPSFISHVPGLQGNGQAFVNALRAREQMLKPGNNKKPLFALSNGELVMIGQGIDAKNPQAAFRVNVVRLVDGKITEYWAAGG